MANPDDPKFDQFIQGVMNASFSSAIDPRSEHDDYEMDDVLLHNLSSSDPDTDHEEGFGAAGEVSSEPSASSSSGLKSFAEGPKKVSQKKQKKDEGSEEFLPKRRRGHKRSNEVLDTEESAESKYVTCCALACTNTSESSELIRLPTDPERRLQWIKRINREDWLPTSVSALCQIHFEPDDWVKNECGEKVLRDDVLPTLNLHGEAIKSWITLDKSGSVKDELVRNSSDDETNDEDGESSVYIKQEALEPDIDMLEATPVKTDPDEAVFWDSNIEKKQDDNLIKDTNVEAEQLQKSQEETIVPEILPMNIKAEPLDILDESEQPFTSLSCPDCSHDFEERWELEHHVREKHPESENAIETGINIKDNSSGKLLKVSDPTPQIASSILKVALKSSPAKTTSGSSISTQVKGATESVPLMVPTGQFVSPVKVKNKSLITSKGVKNTKWKEQYVVLVPQSAVDKQPKFLQVAGPSSAVAPSPPPPPTPTTTRTTYTIDSSARFTISLAEFPASQRVGIKRKMLEVVETVKRLKINPETIVIAHKELKT